MLLVIDRTNDRVLGQLTQRIDLGGGHESLTYVAHSPSGALYFVTTTWTAYVEAV